MSETIADAAKGIVPSGSVIAYAGTVEGDSVDATPQEPVMVVNGWLLCNGAELPNKEPFRELFAAIQFAHGRGAGTNFRVPDYQGRFLRGVDRGATNDPEATARLTPQSGSGNNGDRVGSLQADATHLPRSPFQTDTHAGHQHGDPTWNGGPGPFELATQFRGPGGFDYGTESAPTTVGGSHSHIVNGGGDSETRPKNVYVNWLIKL
ncbi:MAG: tail fiber protein [Fibrella sp.]|nr:tail fiber protein [Armatimonadota bacterium]